MVIAESSGGSSILGCREKRLAAWKKLDSLVENVFFMLVLVQITKTFFLLNISLLNITLN